MKYPKVLFCYTLSTDGLYTPNDIKLKHFIDNDSGVQFKYSLILLRKDWHAGQEIKYLVAFWWFTNNLPWMGQQQAWTQRLEVVSG